MSRPTYDVKQTYVGDGSLAVYTFDFKIESKDQLLVIEVDVTGLIELQRVLGTDTSVYLSSLAFDADEGGGTVTLLANLVTGRTLILLLANDLPTQDFEFSNKTSFDLRRFESALDANSGGIQRLSYRGKQAIRIHDLDDEDVFNAQLPPGVIANANKVLIVNSAGNAMEYGPTASQIAAAEAEAVAAAVSAAAALVSENNAAISETNAAASAADALAAIAGIDDWVTATAYVITSVVMFKKNLYRCITANSDVTFTPAKWERVNGNIVSVTQSLGAASVVVVDTFLNQRVKVKGDSAARTSANAPFGTDASLFVDGMEIMVQGMDDTNTYTIPLQDIQYGCIVNGNAVLTKGFILTLMYDSELERFIEKCRIA